MRGLLHRCPCLALLATTGLGYSKQLLELGGKEAGRNMITSRMETSVEGEVGFETCGL